MELTFYRTVQAHEVEPGDTLHTKRIVVDQIIRDMGDGSPTFLFRGHAPGYKRRQALRVKAGELVSLALTRAQATMLEAAVDDLLETDGLKAEQFACGRTDWHPPVDEDAAMVACQDIAATEEGQRPGVNAHLPEGLDSTADAVEDWARTQGDG